MDFIYDNTGKPYALKYDGTTYYYVLNLQGDVISIITHWGESYGSYTYDAWGNVLSVSGDIANLNPIRYRGYYYDSETRLYYLGSRYYDPAVKRFVNADGYASTGQGFIGQNAFVYCLNNPIRYVDANGSFAVEATLAVTNFWNPLGWTAAAALFFESTIVTVCIVATIYNTYRGNADPTAETVKSSNKQSDSKPKEKAVTVSTPASPKPPKNDKDKNYRGGTSYNRNGIRVDYEYYGNGNGNVHVHFKNGKYWFNTSLHQFVDKNGVIAGKAVQGLLKDPKIAKAILKGLAFISG